MEKELRVDDLKIYWFRKSTGTGEVKVGDKLELPRHYLCGILAFCETTAWEVLANAFIIDSKDRDAVEVFKTEYRLVKSTALDKEGIIFYDQHGPVALYSVASEPCKNINHLSFC